MRDDSKVGVGELLSMTLKSLVTGPGAGARLLGAAMLVGTIAGQHPNVVFNRLQRKDSFSVLPNWRFFAPTPAMHDYHFVYRVLDSDGVASPWRGVDVISGRRLRQCVWFPERRPEKAVFDICSEMLHVIDQGFKVVTRIPAYRVMVEYLRQKISEEASVSSPVQGFQFALARATGYDTSQDPEMIFVSPYTPLDNPAAPKECE